jgi:hypothetical protein
VRRKTKKALKLSAEHAAAALHLLIEDGRIAAADVTKALKNREKLIRDLRNRLESLEKAAAPVARRVAGPAARRRRAALKARKALSAARRNGGACQSLRSALDSRQARVRVKAIRKQSGVAAAIKAAKKLTA